jgi:hypothetical protein
LSGRPSDGEPSRTPNRVASAERAAPERARLAAKVLGLRDPDLPGGTQPDPVIPGLLNQLLDAINDNCDPGVLREEPTSTDVFRLESTARAVQVRLSASVTGLSALRIRDLQLQFGVAQGILRDLAPFVRPLCRPAAVVPAQSALTGIADELVSVAALLGPQLADGTDLFDAARTARVANGVRLADRLRGLGGLGGAADPGRLRGSRDTSSDQEGALPIGLL